MHTFREVFHENNSLTTFEVIDTPGLLTQNNIDPLLLAMIEEKDQKAFYFSTIVITVDWNRGMDRSLEECYESCRKLFGDSTRESLVVWFKIKECASREECLHRIDLLSPTVMNKTKGNIKAVVGTCLKDLLENCETFSVSVVRKIRNIYKTLRLP